MVRRDFNKHPKISCLYFLFLKSKLIYIGQTNDFIERMCNHQYRYKHDCVRWIKCPKNKLIEYEKRLIKIFKPPLNQQYNVANPNGARLTYIAPRWIKPYVQMNDYLIMRRKGIPNSNAEHDIKATTALFKRRYRKDGYSGTFMDPTIEPQFINGNC
jgi:hypothetical protein